MSTTESVAPFDAWRRFLWFAWAAFWLLMLLVSVQDNYVNGDEPLWRPLLWEGSSLLVATVLIAIQLHWLPRLRPLLQQPMRWFGVQLVWLPGVVVGFVIAAYGIRHGVYALLGDTYQHEPWLQVLLYEATKLTIFFGLWTAAQFGIESFIALWQEQQKNFAIQQALTDARRALLQTKIQPHFLFNALNTISAVMHEDVEKAEQLISELSMLLREGLNLDKKSLVPLHQEWQFLQAYSHLMLARFAPRVTMQWQLSDEVRDVQVPPLCLQPLLENMFQHGAEKIPGPFHIELFAKADGKDLLMGLTGSKGHITEPVIEREGMAQVRGRLQLCFDDSASLAMRNRQQGGVEVLLRIRDALER